jgi:hypothetical protein
MADLALRLTETKQLMAALQGQIVPAQVAVVGERRCCCVCCGRRLASKGHSPVTFRSLFGDVPVRVQRLLACPCQSQGGAKSFTALDFSHDAVAPELAYVTARYAALAPFGKVAALLSELLPISGGAQRGHGPKPDAAGGRERCATAHHRDSEAGGDAGSRARRSWA